MKYLLLMQYSIKDLKTEGVPAWTPQEIQKNIEFLQRFNQELSDAGELVETIPLVGPDQARGVSARKNGPPVISDGPFPETKEFLGGLWIIDVETTERAYEIAGRASAMPGRGGVPANMPIEVRQVMGRPSPATLEIPTPATSIPPRPSR